MNNSKSFLHVTALDSHLVNCLKVHELPNQRENTGPILPVKIIAALLDRKGKGGTCVAIANYELLLFRERVGEKTPSPIPQD